MRGDPSGLDVPRPSGAVEDLPAGCGLDGPADRGGFSSVGRMAPVEGPHQPIGSADAGREHRVSVSIRPFTGATARSWRDVGLSHIFLWRLIVQVLPNVSVCIPAYRGENFLAETISSVLDQTYADFELVVLDNASPDDTGEIARSFRDPRVRVVTNDKTIPAPDNWRRAVELCSAPLVKLVCADDLLHPRCLEMQVTAMEADPGLAMVAARRHMIDESSRVLAPARGLNGLIGVRSGIEVARRVVRSGVNPIGEPGSVLFRRADYTTVGGWSPLRPFTMDLDLWMRLLRCGDFLGLPDALAAFRIGRQSMTVNNDEAIALDQKAVIAGLVARPELHVRWIDAAIGQLHAPLGRMRRRLLFSSANRDADHGGRPPQAPTADNGY